MSLFQRIIDEMRAEGRQVENTTQELFSALDKRLASIEGKSSVESDTSVEDDLKKEIAGLHTDIDGLCSDLKAAGDRIAKLEGAPQSDVGDRVSKLEVEVFGDGASDKMPSSFAKPVSPVTPTTDQAQTPGPVADPVAIDKQAAETAALDAIAQNNVGGANQSEDTIGKMGDGPTMAPVPLPNTDPLHPVDVADPVKVPPANDPIVAANTDVEAKTDPRPADQK